jgi:HK97 family phage prohead protease
LKTATRKLNIEKADMTAGAIRVVLSTETPVERQDQHGRYLEVLSHEPGAVDLSRAPLPLIEGHDHARLPVGRIDKLRIDSGRLRGELILSKSQRGQELGQDISDGILTAVSVGYQIIETEHSTREGLDVLTATKWMPFECSLVSVPADPAAGLNRGKEIMTTETETLSRRERAKAKDEAQQREAAIQAERNRKESIRGAFGRHADNHRELLNECLEDPAIDVQEARARLLDDLSKDASPTMGLPVDAVSHGGHGRANFVERAADALLARSGYGDRSKADQALLNTSVLDIARQCIGERGFQTRNPSQLIKRSMSTGDFPLILENVLNKAMRAGSENESATHRDWVRVSDVDDFKSQSRPILSSAPNLEPILELAEYTYGNMTEDATSFTPIKYGRILQLSFEAIQNDDLAAFSRVAAQMGMAATRREADFVYGALTTGAGAGQVMQDTLALFDASHNNAVSVATTEKEFTPQALQEARTLLRRQKDVSGQGWLNLQPRYLLCPPERESEAEILIARSTAHKTSTTDTPTPGWIQGLNLVVEPRLADSDVMYLAASTDQIDTFELGVLTGHPMAEEESQFTTDSVAWKLRHVFGGAFLDWRGIVRITLTAAA